MAELAIATTVGGAFLSAFLQVLFDRLASPALQEFGSLLGVGYELRRLRATVFKIHSVVAAVEETRDPSLALWIGELKRAAYDAEDVLDEFATELLRKRIEGGSGRENSIGRMSSFFSPLTRVNSFDYDISDKINEIRARMEDIAAERDGLRLGEVIGGGRCNLGHDHYELWVDKGRETSSFSTCREVFGRNRDKGRLVDLLLSRVETGTSVVAVVGMAGLGKTTLAQLVFHDPMIQNHFGMKGWVWVSAKFDIKRIIREMLSGRDDIHDMASLETLQNKLARELKGKRLLFVLDDIWNENSDEWLKLRSPLMCGEKGSVVLITTRNSRVAEAMHSVETFHVEELPLEDCWNIFKQSAFVDAATAFDVDTKLVDIGKEIAKKAQGVPLAAKTLGNYLYCRQEEWRWRSVLRSQFWELPQSDQGILSSLRLSYQRLPAQLKQCLAYCSLFPKRYRFEKQVLIQMWMAQGFIQVRNHERMEDVGGDYLDYLLSSSFFSRFLNSAWYVMPNLLHDLLAIISADDCINLEDGSLHDIHEKARFLRHIWFSTRLHPDILCEFKCLRSLLHFSWKQSRIDLAALLENLKCLRTLDLSYCMIIPLPEAIGSLKHLRYLDLSYIGMKELPRSFPRLYNLQTLRLKGCVMLKRLPADMCNLINLRHLIADAKLVSTVNKIGKLTSLQQLEVFDVSKDEKCKIHELKHMTDLREKLCIRNLQNVINKEEAACAMLNNKLNLDTLELKWDELWASDNRNCKVSEEIFESLRPPVNLKKMTIQYYSGTQCPSWMDAGSAETPETLGNLEELSLYRCIHLEVFPCLGKLTLLRNLSIGGLERVTRIGNELTGPGILFPSLEMLEFYDMPEWVEWTVMEGCVLPSLLKLLMRNCPKLIKHGLPLSENLKYLEIEGCPGVLNESLLMFLQDQNSLSFSMRVHYQSLQSCISEALQHLTAAKVLKVRYHNEPVSSSLASPEDVVSLTYCMDPEDADVISSDVELDIYNTSRNFSALRDAGDEVALSSCIIRNLKLLSSLSLHGCQDTRALCLEVLSQLTFLEEFEISCSANLNDFGWLNQSVATLKELRIENCPDLLCLSEVVLKHHSLLETLSISGCAEICSLEFDALISLSSLWIRNCPNLLSATSPFIEKLNCPNWRSPLLFLSIDTSSLLTSSFLQHIPMLQKLTIHCCSHLLYLSHEEEIGLLTMNSLCQLEFTDCKNLQHLPAELHRLCSLRSLLILCCPQLQYLPEKGLPPLLELLEITDCPILLNRCKEGGPDWPLIVHIPHKRYQPEEPKSLELLEFTNIF